MDVKYVSPRTLPEINKKLYSCDRKLLDELRNT